MKPIPTQNRPPCTWCGGPTSEAEGVYLALLYPGRLFCDGCGRGTLHCECGRPEPEAYYPLTIDGVQRLPFAGDIYAALGDYEAPTVAYPRGRASGASETPSVSPPPDEHRSGLTTRGADQGRDEEVHLSPLPGRGLIPPDDLCIPTPDCPHGYPYCGVCEEQPDGCD